MFYILKSKYNKFFVTIILLIICISNHTYSLNPLDRDYKALSVVGDSFAGHFALNEGFNNLYYFIFPFPAITNEKNVEIFEECIRSDKSNFILFATGVNDLIMATRLTDFEESLVTYVKAAKKENKFVLFHTYMMEFSDKIGDTYFKTSDYDNVLRKIAENYDNAFYIDMSNLQHERYTIDDKCHYNKTFYDTLLAKCNYTMWNINEKVYRAKNEWDLINDYSQISVTGDSYAGVFCEYEKDNGEFTLTEFARPNTSTKLNMDLIVDSFNTTAKSILLSIGVNDYRKELDPYEFYDLLRAIANVGLIRRKNIYVHTFMKYPKSVGEEKKYNLIDYDNVLKNIAYEYPNVYYIDMTEYSGTNYAMPDGLHYGKDFNDILFTKLAHQILAYN